MAAWSPDKLLASGALIAMPNDTQMKVVVTSINADYPSSTGMAEYSIGWRSMDGQYHGSARLSHEELAGSEGAILILKPDSVFKEYSQPFEKFALGTFAYTPGDNPFGSPPKPEVTVDLSQIEADLAKLPKTPKAKPWGYAKGTSPMGLKAEFGTEAILYGKPIAEVTSSKITDKGLEVELKMNTDAIDAELLTAQLSAKSYPEPPDPFLEIVKHAAQGVEEELFHATGFLAPPPKPNTYTAQHQLSLPNGVMLGVQLTVVVKDPVEWFNPLTAKGPPGATPPAPWPLISEKFVGSKPKAPAKGKKKKEDPA